MKYFKGKFTLLLGALCLLFLFSNPVFSADAWTTGHNANVQNLIQGKLIDFKLSGDGAIALTSNFFDLQDYDFNSFTTYPIAGEYKGTQANDSLAGAVIIKGSNFPDDINSWVNVDTIASISDTAATYFTLDFNGKKFRTYKAVTAFTAATGVSATFKFMLYLYHPRDEHH